MRSSTSLLYAVFGLLFSFFQVALAIPSPSVIDNPNSISNRSAAISIGDITNLLNPGIITEVTFFLTAETLLTGVMSGSFGVENPLPLDLTIARVSCTAGLDGIVYITFDQTFPFGTSDVEFTIDALGTGVSATFDNVLLAEGVATLLTLLPSSTIDLISVTLEVSVLGIDVALTIPGISQTGIPVTYTLGGLL